MNQTVKRALYIGLSILCIAAVGSAGIFAQARPSAAELEEKTSGLRSEADQLQEKLDALSEEITALSSSIEKTTTAMKETQEEMNEAQENGKDHYEAMKLRIKYMYETGDFSFLELLCSAKDMADFLNKTEFIQNVSEYDRKMMQDLLDIQNQIKQKGETLETQQASLTEMKQELDTRHAELEDKISSTSAQLQLYEEQLAQAKEEERLAALRAAEEKAKKAAQEAAQKNSQDTSPEPSAGDNRQTLQPSSPEPSTPADPAPSTGSMRSLGNFKITHYCPCFYCCGGWGSRTATGSVPTPGRTIAVDPSVIPYGSKVVINGHTYVAEDCGGAIKGNRIDVFVGDHTTALAYGVFYAEVYLVQ